MLKKLWHNFHLAGGEDRPKSTPPIDRDKLTSFIRYFPIGRKLLYYPEYHRKVTFHTIIIGYRVNDRFIYANDAVLLDADEAPTGFRLAGGDILPIGELRRFQLLVPDTSNMERQLDYFTRAELGPAGQFRPGNAITLVSTSIERLLPTIDTTVARQEVMADGPYSGSRTVLLTPDLGSLVVADRRRSQRVQAAVWADLRHARDIPAFRCVLRDFSESALRLSVADTAEPMPMLAENASVSVEFDLGDIAAVYLLGGRVYRRDDESCVVQVERLYRDGKFEKLTTLDIIEIKTQLLNSGA